jgi:hypothetical protein
MDAVIWHTHPQRHVWASQRVARYAEVRADLARRRELVAPLDDPLLACLDRGDPFCFLRTVDTIERVALRDQWEKCNKV